MFTRGNRRRVRGDNAGRSNIFEGDIMLSKKQMKEMISNIPGCSKKGRGGRSKKRRA